MSIFRFKQFEVNQAGCAMKVNTDGVLLAVLANPVKPENILDIGTGTGVISLILAQRFPSANIKAVEIDETAAAAASANFAGSAFNPRLEAFHSSFEEYFEQHTHRRYDLIVSNPPFFIDSLKSDDPLKTIARHTDQLFFENMLRVSSESLNQGGEVSLIIPATISELLQKLALQSGLYLQKKINIRSFSDSIPHREILSFGHALMETEIRNFVIYSKPKEYSGEYRAILKDFFTIF